MSITNAKDTAGPGPWVSFCISTFKRPTFLKSQLERLARQTNGNYEVVISDNDPDGSAAAVVEAFGDPRIRYYSNETNLGMVKSFNLSLARATTPYIVMVTDDDPVYPSMLKELAAVIASHPGYPIYCGCLRRHKGEGKIEVFDKDNFVFQLLHPGLTKMILWSSCILDREAALAAGGMADYGSPHLADHALLALCSRYRGGVMINKMYSEFSSHTANFSKTSFDLYYIGCREFYALITASFPEAALCKGSVNALVRHLEVWFIAMSSALRRFFAHRSKDRNNFKSASESLSRILALPFMRGVSLRYQVKKVIFFFKYPLFRLGIIKP